MIVKIKLRHALRIADEGADIDITPFGYTRKDVLLIGLGVTAIGFGLKSGLEFVGVDPLQAGNVVQLVMVLGLTVGWISTYIFRVSNKEMTYAQQLRDYEVKVMEKRLEGLTEAELVALLEQVEEEKRQQARGEQVN
ncbi:dnaJ-like protein 1 [Hibiscus syriacus]|uniref:DnaJ-like protein 1 n=1 Tax=Hibiscus syriacus TaxID=106335 RepID=A0A6A3BMS3_HIBSY|nr:dnaJ-like protein 1 [Hibiscus syriacus]